MEVLIVHTTIRVLKLEDCSTVFNQCRYLNNRCDTRELYEMHHRSGHFKIKRNQFAIRGDQTPDAVAAITNV